MPKYKYIKAPPGYTLAKPTSPIRKLRVLVSAVFLTAGITAFTSVAYPMIAYQISYAPKLEKSKFLSPVKAPLAPTVKVANASGPTFLPEVTYTTLDYTDSETWFPKAAPQSSSVTSRSYTLSIPELGIKDALVRDDHTDLKKSLIHYPGTAMPGDLGNTVIFGHSVLPQFFNPDNYTTIFSTLHTLDVGDEILIDSDGASYTYRITDMYSVTPDDLTPLAQTFDKHRLTIITCTPPGTYLKRLIVKAELI